MIRGARGRLKKLEAAIEDKAISFTKEEFCVARYELLVAIARAKRAPELIARAQELAGDIAAELKRQVIRHADPQFIEHMDSYVLPVWKERMGAAGFILPLVGSEYDDWEAPNLYSRRLAVRNRASVIELIGSPDSKLAAGNGFPDIWRTLHLTVIRHTIGSANQYGGLAI